MTAQSTLEAAKLIDDLISAWYSAMPFSWPEMLPSELVQRVKVFQRLHSSDPVGRWHEDDSDRDSDG